MLVAAAGAIEHEAIVAEAEKRFASFNGPAAPAPRTGAFRRRHAGRDPRSRAGAYRAGAAKACRSRDEQLYSLQVFTSVLGGGMSSRLFQEVREKRGLCYTISAFHMPYSDTGLFGLYAGTDEADAPELMRVAIDQIALATETLNEAEVARAKAQMKAGLLMALESSEARLGQIARQMLAYGRPIPLDEIVAKVDAVTVESARAAGRALIGRGKPAIAALGPGNGLESTAAIAESLVSRAADWGALAVLPWRFSAPSLSAKPMPAIAGDGVMLRAPQSSDHAEWAALRETSRAFLMPWEPTWPSDDLTRGAFRRRLKRYAEDQRSDLAYAFLIFRSDDNALVGGLTLANIRRGVAQAGTIGYWVGAPFARQGLHDRGGARVDPVLLWHAAAASAGGGLHPGQYRLDPPAGKNRLPARGLCAQLSVHQRRLAGSSALCPAQG